MRKSTGKAGKGRDRNMTADTKIITIFKDNGTVDLDIGNGDTINCLTIYDAIDELTELYNDHIKN